MKHKWRVTFQRPNWIIYDGLKNYYINSSGDLYEVLDSGEEEYKDTYQNIVLDEIIEKLNKK